MTSDNPAPALDDLMVEALDLIDRMLAEDGQPLHLRPLSAAMHFVDLCILKVDDTGDGVGNSPGKLTDYAASKWFQAIYKKTEAWYRTRFGDAMEHGESGLRDATVLILGTPRLLRVPMTTSKPGVPGESFWLCYHDTIQPDEDVLSWVQNGPIFTNLASKDVKAARTLSMEIATRMRAINIALMGMESSDVIVTQLRNGILPNLERAARYLVTSNAEEVRLAHWDMQMACERAMKCLAQQRSGGFKETHDLFYLYDYMPEACPPFPRTELSKLPNWEKMAEFRYGGGPYIPIRQAFRSYRAAVSIVAATTKAFKMRYHLGSFQVHLKRPPWAQDD